MHRWHNLIVKKGVNKIIQINNRVVVRLNCKKQKNVHSICKQFVVNKLKYLIIFELYCLRKSTWVVCCSSVLALKNLIANHVMLPTILMDFINFTWFLNTYSSLFTLSTVSILCVRDIMRDKRKRKSQRPWSVNIS